MVRVRLKFEVWDAMPIEEFVPKMRSLLRSHPQVLHDKTMSALLHRARQKQIITYVEAERRNK